MVKLTVRQQEKIEKMQAFLKTDIGKDGLMLDDCDYTYIMLVKKMWVTGLGINIIGETVHGMTKRDFLLPREIGNLYTAAKRGDEEFKEFINKGE